MTEHELQNQIIEYLNYKWYFVWKNNTGSFPIESNGKTRYFRGGKKGSSDILGIHKDGSGRMICIECKVGKNKTTPAQDIFLEEIRKRGGVAFVAYSLEDVIKIL